MRKFELESHVKRVHERYSDFQCDKCGKILSKKSHNSQETLNIDNLSDGIYMLSIESGSLKTTKKVILSR